MREERRGLFRRDQHLPSGQAWNWNPLWGIADMLRVQVQDLTPILCLYLPHPGFMLLFLLGEVFPSSSPSLCSITFLLGSIISSRSGYCSVSQDSAWFGPHLIPRTPLVSNLLYILGDLLDLIASDIQNSMVFKYMLELYSDTYVNQRQLW